MSATGNDRIVALTDFLALTDRRNRKKAATIKPQNATTTLIAERCVCAYGDEGVDRLVLQAPNRTGVTRGEECTG